MKKIFKKLIDSVPNNIDTSDWCFILSNNNPYKPKYYKKYPIIRFNHELWGDKIYFMPNIYFDKDS